MVKIVSNRHQIFLIKAKETWNKVTNYRNYWGIFWEFLLQRNLLPVSCPALEATQPWLVVPERPGLAASCCVSFQQHGFWWVTEYQEPSSHQHIKVWVKFNVHTDINHNPDTKVGAHENPASNPTSPAYQEICSFSWGKPFTRAPGITPAPKNITLLEKVIPNTLPFLGVAEENQRDSAIYGGHLEL